ncbi:MAG TPA: hypothetical protein VKT49_14460 [Bryobacteraceae bacterium]|nr:hypothetical protein [Bryobacteraceae bacterium]
MKRVLRVFTLLILGVGIAAYAQQPGRSTPPDQGGPSQQRTPRAQPDEPGAAQPGDVQKMSVTGCLSKGSQANQYVITDSSSHEKYSFPGPAQLDAYVNQTVKLTGSMQSDGNGEKVFRPESIAPVSSSCS